MESSDSLTSYVAQVVNLFKEILNDSSPLSPWSCDQAVERISSAGTLIQQAVQCFLEFPNIPLYNLESGQITRTEELLSAMIDCDGVTEALSAWRGEVKQNILHFAFKEQDSFLLRLLAKKKIGADLVLERDQHGHPPISRQNTEHCLLIKDMHLEEIQAMVKKLLLSKYRSQCFPRILLPHLQFNQEDKIKCEQILNQMSSYDLHYEEFLYDVWYKAAQTCPSSNDITMATKIIDVLVQNHLQYAKGSLLHNMLQSYPNIDVDHLVTYVQYWPRPGSHFVAAYIRSNEAPYWLVKAILGTTLNDCNENWIKKQLAKKTTLDESLVEKETVSYFHYFEALPEDLLYYLISHLHFKQVIALSRANKRMFRLVNESQHVWGQLGHKYFNELRITSARNFGQKYKSKFRTGKLLHHFGPNQSYKISIELNGQSALLVQSDGAILLLRTNCLDQPKKRRKQLQKIQLEAAIRRSARLFKDHIFILTAPLNNERRLKKCVTIIDTNDTQRKYHIDCPYIDNNPYFTIDEKTLLAKGFAMDLASERITEQNWNLDLSKWIIQDGIIYGSQIVRYFEETGSSTACLKLFDQRTPEKLAAALHLQNLRCFNVSDHDIYAVTSHIMQWDKRFLSHPVRQSSDPYYSSKNIVTGYPAIDLTSMTVIGPDQIWDLTDFTWQLQKPVRVPPRITTNGILVAYKSGAVDIRQNPCTYAHSPLAHTQAVLNCNIREGHLI